MARYSGFNKQTSIFLAAVCGQTYAQYDNKDGAYVVPDGYQVAAEFEAKSFNGLYERFGYILESTDQVIIAFRGTASHSDWVSDAMARQEPYPWVGDAGATHRGFTDIYGTARYTILSALDKIPSHKTLYITGHSLGGALATLCAVDIKFNSRFASPQVYTLGSPRVGNPDFADKFNRSIGDKHRIYNKKDIIPHLPPFISKIPKQAKIYYYLHVNRPYQLDFKEGSVGANHMIDSYFAALSALDPIYATEMSKKCPGFCPSFAHRL